jgi:hypothetical protein
MRPGGGAATYANDRGVRRSYAVPGDFSFAGWCAAHSCVTAAVAGVPAFAPQARAYLREQQEEDGSWRAYWWLDREYATALAAEALAAGEEAGDRLRVERAVRWAVGRLDANGAAATSDHPAGSPFATAWCLRMLSLGADDPKLTGAADRAAAWLRRGSLGSRVRMARGKPRRDCGCRARMIRTRTFRA